MSERRDVWDGRARNEDPVPKTKAEARDEWVRFWVFEDRGLPAEQLNGVPGWYGNPRDWRTNKYLLGNVQETRPAWPSRQERLAIQYRDAGYVQREIAAVFRVSKGRVSQILARAMRKLALLGAPPSWLAGDWPKRHDSGSPAADVKP